MTEEEVIAEKRAPKRRNGRIVGLLRRRQAIISGGSGGSEPLDLGTASQRLQREELTVALKYHLTYMSQGLVTAPVYPPVIDMTSFHDEVRQRGLRFRDLDSRQEVLMGCLFALGARRSWHSGITGRAEASMSTDLIHKHQRQWDGARKEIACRALAQRTVDLVVAGNLMEDPSCEAKQALSVLRVTLFAVSPRHPFGSQLAAHLHKMELANFAETPFKETKSIAELGRLSLIVEYDSYMSILLRAPPKISETELSLVYGWNSSMIPEAVRFVQTQKPCTGFRWRGKILAIDILRNLGKLQRKDSVALSDLPSFCRTLQHILTSLDTLEGCMKIFADHPEYVFGDTAETTTAYMPPMGHSIPRVTLAPHVSSLPMFVETVMADTVDRLFRPLVESEPKVQELITLVQQRFLGWLKLYIRFVTKEGRFEVGHFCIVRHRHTLSMLLSVLDLYEGWLVVVTEAARKQAVCGDSTLLSWEDLKQLRRLLSDASTVTVRSANQFQALSAVLREANVEVSDLDAPPLPQLSTEDLTYQHNLAAMMVKKVLAEMMV